MNKYASYIFGLTVSIIVGGAIASLGYFALIYLLGYKYHLLYIVLSVAIFLYLVYKIFKDGIYKIGETHKTVALFLGSPTEYILGPGMFWWLPSYLGGGSMKDVNINKQYVKLAIGDVYRNDIVSGDGVSMQYNVTVWYKITDPYKWLVEFGESPEQFLRTILLAVLRPLSSRSTARKLMHIKRDAIDKIQNHISKKLMDQAGAQLVEMAFEVEVPNSIAKEWEQQAAEKAQKIKEKLDLQTMTEMIRYVKTELENMGYNPSWEDVKKIIMLQRGWMDYNVYGLDISPQLESVVNKILNRFNK